MNQEEIYDGKIGPLMTTIIALCKEHKIAMIASFSIPTEDDTGLSCTTVLLEDECEPTEALLLAKECIYPTPAPAMHLTVRDADGNVPAMETVLP